MGVSGSGKSTIARRLSSRLGFALADADDFHTSENREKLAAARPLSDADRKPWLEALGTWLAERERSGQSSVLACSALRRQYRDRLRAAAPGVWFLHPRGPEEVIARRMRERDHFASPDLLASQVTTLEDLESDEAGMTVDATRPIADIVAHAEHHLSQPETSDRSTSQRSPNHPHDTT